jgi:hypothetical protein
MTATGVPLDHSSCWFPVRFVLSQYPSLSLVRSSAESFDLPTGGLTNDWLNLGWSLAFKEVRIRDYIVRALQELSDGPQSSAGLFRWSEGVALLEV